MSNTKNKIQFGKDIEMTADEINEFLAHSDGSDDDDNDWNNLPELGINDFIKEVNENQRKTLPKSESRFTSQNRPSKPKKMDIGIGQLFDAPVSKEVQQSSSLQIDSDNEDVANDEQPYLSQYGSFVHEKMKSERNAAHSKKVDLQIQKEDILKERLNAMEEKRKRAINALKTCREPVHTNGATVEAGDYFTAVPTRIRIIRPRISTELWQSRTSDRLVLSVSEIVRQQRLQDLSSREWITVGVLISKSSSLLSRKGNSYSIWKLNDLADLETRVSLFLFGRIQNELWKESEGSVIAILKPKIMESKEQASLKSEDVSLTVDDSVQVLVLGHSLDAGTCLGTTKSGNKCTKIVNKSRSKYCDFHVKSAYKKATVSRPGFANITFPTFKNEAKRQSQPGVFIGASYSGQTLEPPEKKPRLGKLTDFSLKSLENRPELSNNVVNWGLVDQASFSKVIKNKEKSFQKTIEKESASKVSKCETPSTSKSSSKTNPLETRHQEILSSNEDAFASMLSRPSAGSMNFFKHLIQKELPENSSTGSSSPPSSKQPSLSKPSLNKSNSFSSFFTNMAKGSTPCLGRGASNEGFVNLTSPPTGEKLRARALNKKELMVRQRAIELVRSKGGVANMMKTAKEKRHQEIKDKLEVAALKKSQQSESSSKKSTSETVNGLDLNSEELRRRLSKGSRHSSLVDVQERIEQDAYFDKLAHKEQLEEKLISMHEQKVKVVYCKMCRYKSLTPSEQCKSSNHPLVRYEGLLRYFKCSDCKERTTTLDRYPTIACKKCEGSSFVKTGMKPERKGPKLESETLLIRGEERKWVNS